MCAPYTELYVHLILSTWDRLPLISGDLQNRLYAAILAKCKDLGCEPLAIGGIEDHVHLLVRLNPAMAVAQLVKEVKGSSSHLANHVLKPGEFFKWQGAYAAFTIRKSEVHQVIAYIENQAAHHATGQLEPGWEPGVAPT